MKKRINEKRFKLFINGEKEKLYGLFEDVFGEDSVDGMPETADEIEGCLFVELRQCGKQVDASKVADIILGINFMRYAEELFHEADKAAPDSRNSRSACRIIK